MTEKSNIQKLMDEIETYKQAIADAEGALVEAERELDEMLVEEYEKENQTHLTNIEEP